jgi:hypothetical protein
MRLTTKLIPPALLPVAVAVVAFAWGARTAPARPKASSAAAARSASMPKAKPNPRLKGAYRFERNGWVYVHLQGSPTDIGYQHGYLLAPEIADAFHAVRVVDTHNTQRPWSFFRNAAQKMLWPRIDQEYQAELRGIVAGLHARGVKMDLDDVVALNAFEELADYYVPWYNARNKKSAYNAPHLYSPGNCSAFIATGSYTKDHNIVIGHNAWTNYINGERWHIIFDIVPTHGYRILMDGFPGVITSDDDFGMNSDGIVITETTISQYAGWNPNGIPEFERSRKALQYASSITDYVKIMKGGNNGGYANDWLIGDRKNGEIARFEEGLTHTRLWTTKDGFFVGSNFPSDPAVTKDETTFNVHDLGNSANARHLRWNQLMKQYKGKIDVQLAENFESDSYDAYAKKQGPDQRSLCGRNEGSKHGVPIWGWAPYFPGGTVQEKVADSQMVAHMTLNAHMGPACGKNFYAKPFLAAHPQFDWMKPVLRDMLQYPWTTFTSGETQKH